jgi:uncharacterized protein YPO0396
MDTSLPDRGAVGEASSASAAFVLTHLEVYDWGAFAGRHCAEIDIEGTAIIGPTGSGKTTLVDALMTLITANPRYNLASTGGHESDRDLVSYVRGVSGAGNNSGDNEHIARQGAVVTGIAARFSSAGSSLRIGAVFWFDGSSSAVTDLKRRWIFCESDSSGLDDWLEAHHAGGARALKQLEHETPGLKIYDSKQAYLARLRGFFEVGENAFSLLNRAAGLKQLNSIDEIFRELVLDDHSAFARATEVAKEFDDLAEIHSELEVARQQRESLLPIAEGWSTRQACLGELALHQKLNALIPIWYAGHADRLWGERAEDLQRAIDGHEQASERLNAEIETVSRHAQTLRDIYLQAGGASIEQLREQIDAQTRAVEERERLASDYQRLVGGLGMDKALSPEALQTNQTLARERQESLQEISKEQKERAWALGVEQRRQQEEKDELQTELDQVKAKPASNIPGAYHQFRSSLAEHLGLDEDALPFVAELVEVQRDQSRWRGAIERAIGGHRLRVMVPGEAIKAALAWVNHRDNRLHIRFLEVKAPAGPISFFEDGFTRKLNFKAHPYRESLKRLLADIDRHCVDSPEDLRHTAHGMTDRGLMSGKNGFFEKQDQRSLQSDWMTGFDNQDRLASLNAQLKTADAALAESSKVFDAAKKESESTEQTLRLLQQLIELRFSDIDLPGAQRQLDSLNQRLAALTDPDSDVEKARLQWQEVNAQVDALRNQERDHAVAKSGLEVERKQSLESRERARRRLAGGLDEEQSSLAAAHLIVPDAESLGRLDDLERTALAAQSEQIEKKGARLKNLEQDLIRFMSKAQKLDTGALSEAGTEMQDVPRYLERLRILTEEALPEKMRRFLDYLNQSSDQGVTQLLSDIENEVSTIEERIEDLNRTLERVDFQPCRYLRLEPQRVVHESLRTLQQAQRHLRAAALKDDQGESHYGALRHMVDLLRDAADRKKTLGARALLDPRYRLQFAVSVIERGTGAVIETRTSSQGGSGGEKEIIASYVLTASLSYALCPAGRSQPLFGTIVLDEAFSKSSQAVAGRIIRALNEFGLHALFVTPNKELRLLRVHTRSAIVIHRKGQRATMTSLSWQELEARARQRSPQHDEVAS